MLKRKEEEMIYEMYAKKVINEISSEMPFDEEPEAQGERSLKKDEAEQFIIRIKGAVEVEDFDAVKNIVKAFYNFLNDGEQPEEADYSHAEPHHEEDQGTGRYLSKKQQSSDFKTNHLIDRMGLKFPKNG
jgi:hypothetical protein